VTSVPAGPTGAAGQFVDLHSHSTASDGTLPPAEVVRLAHRAGLSALALTDHDTVAGIREAEAEAKSLRIDFIAGIEISAEFPHPGTMHILGYGVDPLNPALAELTETLLAGRDNRNPRIVEGFRVFREAKELRDPLTNQVLGYEAQYLGSVDLARSESIQKLRVSSGKMEDTVVPATVDITRVKEEMRVGDRLLPEPPVPRAQLGSNGSTQAHLEGAST
jgi:hypothetical protein